MSAGRYWMLEPVPDGCGRLIGGGGEVAQAVLHVRQTPSTGFSSGA
jgi:hypothetical protein